ncbi:MAG: secretin N-terminal domain-containing protein [Acidobacteriota bacterium]
MKKSAYVRFSITMFLLLSMLSPTIILAGGDKEGKKHFKEGMKAENSEVWDKAVEEFALAVVEDPKNPEYRLHYQRSLFNASQMYMKRGTALAEQKDYAGAYLAFRKAYGYDPTNELAKSETERVLRMQQALLNGDDPENPPPPKDKDSDLRLVKTAYGRVIPQDVVIPQKLEKLRDLPFPGGVDLKYIIKQLAQELDLNVLFDSESFRQDRKISIELKNVTAAKALDYIFLQEGLFFQKVGPRTIMIGIQNRRQFFQQLVLRTFYLANADPTEVAKTIQAAIPPQPGRAPTIPLVDKSTNSITIRDTSENVRIIGNLINSLDKDRAEVVMDVQIYEVNKTDLLQLGNQVGTSGSLTNLGGTTASSFGNNEFGITKTATNAAGNVITSIVPQALGIGLIIPAINLVALQDKQNTKLIASTQIHAFNNEDSSARIGQRVPVRTATISNGFNNNGNSNGGVNNNNGGGFLGDVINYEQVGLTLKFTPIVFPNQDVQVKMKIESKDVSGARTLTPLFTERTIEGTARVQNNKTLLLASVAQNSETNGRTGLPLLGLIPIIGRLFTAPLRDNRQIDIVIAVTPRVIRAPAILPEDLIERPTGSVVTPTSGSLESLIMDEEIEEQLAAARRVPNVATVQLPDQKDEAPTYIKSTSMITGEKTVTEPTAENQPAETSQTTKTVAANIKPIDSGVKTLQIVSASDTSGGKLMLQQTSLKVTGETPIFNAPTADLQFLPNLPEMKKGDKTKIAIMVRSATAFREAIIGLKFDDKKIAVRSISYGSVFGSDLAQTFQKPFLNENGKTFVSLSSPKDTAQNSSGMLAYIEVEALADGKHEITFDKDILNFLTADGKNFVVKF